MSKYNLSWDQNKYEKYLKEGRGSGIYNDYKPWITIHDFPSKGVSSRTPGWKSNRVHHFLSLNELRYFYLLEWSKDVIDIREQFPLLDLEDAIKISGELGIKYPADKKSGMPYILTSDFMITVKRNNKEEQLVRTIKPAADLEKRGVIEKFEIERRYWEKRDIDWGIVTENEISKTFSKNVEWIHSSYNLEPTAELELEYLISLCESLKNKFNEVGNTVRNITMDFDREMNLEKGTALYLFKHLIARKQIIIDLNNKIGINSSTDSIKKIIKNNDRVMAL